MLYDNLQICYRKCTEIYLKFIQTAILSTIYVNKMYVKLLAENYSVLQMCVYFFLHTLFRVELFFGVKYIKPALFHFVSFVYNT